MFINLWMQKDVICLSPEQSLAEAETIMKSRGIRRLPVVDGDKLAGIISEIDLKRAMPSITNASYDESATRHRDQTKVRTLMTANPLTVSPMEPLEQVAAKMRKNKIGGIPVVENDQLVGIITESDIFQAFAEILGAYDTGSRVELKISHDPETFYQVMEICDDNELTVTSISMYHGYSKSHQLLTMRLQGDNIEKAVEEFWQLSDCQVNTITAE